MTSFLRIISRHGFFFIAIAFPRRVAFFDADVFFSIPFLGSGPLHCPRGSAKWRWGVCIFSAADSSALGELWLPLICTVVRL